MPCIVAGPLRRAICLRAHCPGMDGDFQRPAYCISTTEALAAARDCADPFQSLQLLEVLIQDRIVFHKSARNGQGWGRGGAETWSKQ